MKKPVLVILPVIFLYACNHHPSNPEPGPAPAPNTAAYKLDAVGALAASYGRGLQLMSVRSMNVDIDGTSETWQYLYADTGMPPTCYWFHATSAGVAFDSSMAMMVGSGFIRHRWCNSDSALILAEQHGGTQFRSAHAACAITASLGEPVVPNARTFWLVTYQSTGNQPQYLAFSIDADSAVVTMLLPR